MVVNGSRWKIPPLMELEASTSFYRPRQTSTNFRELHKLPIDPYESTDLHCFHELPQTSLSFYKFLKLPITYHSTEPIYLHQLQIISSIDFHRLQFISMEASISPIDFRPPLGSFYLLTSTSRKLPFTFIKVGGSFHGSRRKQMETSNNFHSNATQYGRRHY